MRIALQYPAFLYLAFAVAPLVSQGAARNRLPAPQSVLRQAQDRYNHTEYPEAITLLKNAPQTAETLELMGRCYLMEAQQAKAVEVLEKAVALAPSNSMTFTWLGRAYGRRAETSFPLAAVGWATKSRQAFEKAVQLDPANGEAVNDLFEFYLQAPSVMGGGQDKARALIPLMAKIDPAEASFAEGKLSEHSKKFSDAESALRRAIELAPTQAGRVVDLARFLARQGRFPESERAFDEADKLEPGAPKLLFARAQTWIHTKRNIPQAKDLLARYIAAPNRTPDDPTRLEAQKLLHKAEGL